jgi:hypothetical protein
MCETETEMAVVNIVQVNTRFWIICVVQILSFFLLVWVLTKI